MSETMEEQEQEPIEYTGLVLEDELIDHLANADSAMVIYRDGFTPDLLPEDENNLKELLKFVLDYIVEYGTPPAPEIISDEIGYDEFNTPKAPVDYVLSRFRNQYQRRQIDKITKQIARAKSDPTTAIAVGLDGLLKLRQETSSKKGVVTSDDLLQTLDDYRARKDGKTGVTFGFQHLDDHFGGLKVGELTVVLARPKRYKSWVLLKSATDALFDPKNDGDIAFASLELSADEMRDRFHCMAAGVSWSKFKHGLLRREDEKAMEAMARELLEHPYKMRIFRPNMGDRTVSHLSSYAQEYGSNALYIDQLSWFDGARDDRAWQKIGTIMEELKDVAQEFPIYMAAQYNREAAAVDGIADLAKIGLADYIGQTADNLLGIYASKDMMQSTPRIIHLGVVESRSYEGGTWEIKVELSEHSNFRCLGELGSH